MFFTSQQLQTRRWCELLGCIKEVYCRQNPRLRNKLFSNNKNNTNDNHHNKIKQSERTKQLSVMCLQLQATRTFGLAWDSAAWLSLHQSSILSHELKRILLFNYKYV
jgi:hypothetical protein